MKKSILMVMVAFILGMTMTMGAWATTATSNTVTLVVNDLPVVTVDVTEGYAGTAFNFTVTDSGTVSNYQWQFDDGTGWVDIGANVNNFSIAAGAVTNTGAYRCIETNGAGTVTSLPVTINVYDLPTVGITVSIDGGPDLTGSVEVNAGSVAVFTATPAGGWGVVPAYTYQWQKDGADIVGETGLTLTINVIDGITNAGAYTCIVNDGH